MKLLKNIKDKKLPKKGSYKFREASRAILFDENNLVPLLFVSSQNYHKLPGGGIEKGENKIEACVREILEETGCEMEVGSEVGKVEEYRSEFNLRQISYCYLGKVIKKGEQHLEESEKKEGLQLVWLTLSEAIKTLEGDKPQNYEGSFIKRRDLAFLKKAQKLKL